MTWEIRNPLVSTALFQERHVPKRVNLFLEFLKGPLPQ